MNPNDTADLDALAGDPQFRIPDYTVDAEADSLPLAGEVNWGHEKFGIDPLRKVSPGAGFKVGVVDTGVDDSHPLLQGVKARDFTGSASGYRDRNGHGTHCSGTVFGRDPRIGVGPELIGYHGKGLSDSGSGGMSALLNAIEWCLSEGCQVVSCSWGGGTTIDQTTARKFREWAEAGVWLTFAGGNSGPNTPQTDAPGNSLDAINIAALDSSLNVATFSSAGAKIDSSGPGVNIWSARPGGGFTQMSGTSMATPWAAGVLALFRSGLVTRGMAVPKVAELRQILRERSMDVGPIGVDRRTGPGAIMPVLLANYLTALPPTMAV